MASKYLLLYSLKNGGCRHSNVERTLEDKAGKQVGASSSPCALASINSPSCKSRQYGVATRKLSVSGESWFQRCVSSRPSSCESPACKFHVDTDQRHDGTDIFGTDTDPISWHNFIGCIISSHCLTCHSTSRFRCTVCVLFECRLCVCNSSV